MSDTLVYQMARTGAEDGRPMVVLVMADFDPAGRQMAVSIARKLQAFRDLHFPALEFEVHAIALNEDQVRELGLPSTPLKDTEKRADRWRAEFGLEQTEIDALATLRPDVLRRIVEEAIAPFYDKSLDRRTRAARQAFIDEAQSALDDRVDSDLIEPCTPRPRPSSRTSAPRSTRSTSSCDRRPTPSGSTCRRRNRPSRSCPRG